jgi:CheY-like chemotaxis protein
MDDGSQIVTFQFSCSDSKTWVAIESGAGEPQVIEMRRKFPNCWTASAWLMPGEYRCRYYSGNDRQVVYHGPANVDGAHRGSTMDGLVRVGIPRTSDKPRPNAILLVEDNPATLAALEKLLTRNGHRVHTADGYQTALDVAGREQFDLTLCDIDLWDGDGCDLLRELRQHRTFNAIAVTGHSLPDEMAQYRDAGFALVLRKPLHPLQIFSAISSLARSPLNDAPPALPA